MAITLRPGVSVQAMVLEEATKLLKEPKQITMHFNCCQPAKVRSAEQSDSTLNVLLLN